MADSIKGSPVQEFKKYESMGAYHWKEARPSVRLSFNPYLQARYRMAYAHVPNALPGQAAADIGSGDGYFTYLLGKKGYVSTGIDGSPEAVRLGNELLKTSLPEGIAKLEAGNLFELPFAASSLDLVVSLDVIEHVDKPHLMLEEIKRVAKKGATVLIGTPIRVTEYPLDRYHVQEFFPEEFRAMMERHFAKVKIVTSHPVEFLAFQRWNAIVLGRRRPIGHRALNLFVKLTGNNPFMKTNGQFPTYQLAVCES